ncbi:hypothetical protein, partial [Endozoicomonas sp. YOMI1]|uniref:hypothetical protein n=1 Tax=Endozoicomonas sp. YOMI1 TaxID=2828739 RepID=UPI002147544B
LPRVNCQRTRRLAQAKKQIMLPARQPIELVAPILVAAGVDRKTAMSSESGLAIPFGFTLKMQEYGHYKYPIRGAQTSASDAIDAAEEEAHKSWPPITFESTNLLSTSGINPLPCTAEKEYKFSTKTPPDRTLAEAAGIIWVKTVTSLPGIETTEDLKRWIDRQKVDPEKPELPGIL